MTPVLQVLLLGTLLYGVKGRVGSSLWIALCLLDSLRALKTERTNGRRYGVATRRRRMRQCLLCWIVIVTAQPLAWFCDATLSWIPFYDSLKMSLVLATLAWRHEFAAMVVQMVLVPFIRRYETHIDLTLSLVHDTASILLLLTVEYPRNAAMTAIAAISASWRGADSEEDRASVAVRPDDEAGPRQSVAARPAEDLTDTLAIPATTVGASTLDARLERTTGKPTPPRSSLNSTAAALAPRAAQPSSRGLTSRTTTSLVTGRSRIPSAGKRPASSTADVPQSKRVRGSATNIEAAHEGAPRPSSSRPLPQSSMPPQRSRSTAKVAEVDRPLRREPAKVAATHRRSRVQEGEQEPRQPRTRSKPSATAATGSNDAGATVATRERKPRSLVQPPDERVRSTRTGTTKRMRSAASSVAQEEIPKPKRARNV